MPDTLKNIPIVAGAIIIVHKIMVDTFREPAIEKSIWGGVVANLPTPNQHISFEVVILPKVRATTPQR